jgi:LysM repeat protein
MKKLRLFAIMATVVASLAVAAVTPIGALPTQGQHQVLPGETLYCIGRGYGVAPWAIAQANGLAVLAGLSIGQVLTIPTVAWVNIPLGPVCPPQFQPVGLSPATVPVAAAPASIGNSVYLVQRGDSLWRIGNLHGVSVAALMTANNLQTSLIYVGQQLLIPGTALSALPTPTLHAQSADDSPVLSDNVPATPIDQAPLPQASATPAPATDIPPPLPSETATSIPEATSTGVPPTETPVSPTNTAVVPTETASVRTNTPVPSATMAPAGDPLNCAVPNIAWSQSGQLLRGGQPEAGAFACLAAAGVDVLIDQRPLSEDHLNEPLLAQQAGLEYINLGIGDDTAPSPAVLAAWIETVNLRLGQGQIVLVHDAAGRGRMGFWDAVYFMLRGTSAASAIEDRYLAKALPFSGAKIGCGDGGNGQVQALAEIAQILTGTAYYPAVDEYGTAWANCARPAYMAGWDYGAILP